MHGSRAEAGSANIHGQEEDKNVRGQRRGSQGGKMEKPDLPLHEEKESFKVRIIMHLTEQNKKTIKRLTSAQIRFWC